MRVLNRRYDAWIALGLFAVGWAVRLVLASRLAFPPLDDPAFYVQTARNLAAGRGLVSDVLWSYQFPFDHVTHPSHEYWMPLATLLMAAWIRAFGDSLLVAQLPGALCGALLVPLTYLLGRAVSPDDRRVPVGASLLVLTGALPVYQSGSADASAPFALVAAGALLVGGLAIERRSARLCFAAGVLGGLAYLARADGLLLPLVLGASMLACLGFSRRTLALFALMALGAAVLIGPWWIRNLRVFGVMQPVPALTAAVLQDYAQMFNWNASPTLSSLMQRGLSFVVGLRLQALWHNLGVWTLIAFPYGLFGWIGLVRSGRVVLGLGLVYSASLLAISALVFSVPTMAGLFYHSAGAMLPWLGVGAARVLIRMAGRLRLAAFGLSAASAALVVAQCMLSWPAVIEDAARNARTFDAAAAWLAANARPGEPVIATQAHSLNYASGQPAVSLPVAQDVDTLRSLARHYGARYVLITERVGVYPDALDAELGAGVALVAQAPNLLVYQLLDNP